VERWKSTIVGLISLALGISASIGALAEVNFSVALPKEGANGVMLALTTFTALMSLATAPFFLFWGRIIEDPHSRKNGRIDLVHKAIQPALHTVLTHLVKGAAQNTPSWERKKAALLTQLAAYFLLGGHPCDQALAGMLRSTRDNVLKAQSKREWGMEELPSERIHWIDIGIQQTPLPNLNRAGFTLEGKVVWSTRTGCRFVPTRKEPYKLVHRSAVL